MYVPGPLNGQQLAPCQRANSPAAAAASLLTQEFFTFSGGVLRANIAMSMAGSTLYVIGSAVSGGRVVAGGQCVWGGGGRPGGGG